MPAHAAHDKIQITIDGTKYNIPAGTYSIAEIVALTGINKKTAKLTVTQAAAAQAAAINGNDSYNIIGGEVLTSTIGA